MASSCLRGQPEKLSVLPWWGRTPEVWLTEWKEDLSLSLVLRLLVGDLIWVPEWSDRGVHEDDWAKDGSSEATEVMATEAAGDSAARLLCGVATSVVMVGRPCTE